MTQQFIQQQIIQSDDCNFSIKRLNASDKVTQVSVSFPLISRPKDLYEHNNCDEAIVVNRSTPAFNNDGYYFTPCFVLDNDLNKVEKNLNSYFNFHVNKVNQMEEEKDQILVPKPSKNHTFCGICRFHYEDYLTHIVTEEHQEKIKKAKFLKNIEGFNRVLEKKDKRIVKMNKKNAPAARRGRPSKKQRQTLKAPQSLRLVNSQSQPLESQQVTKKEADTVTPMIQEPVSWVGQFLA